MLLECRKYPGIRIGLGRKQLKRLKETTLVTLLREVHPIMGVSQFHYVYSEMRGSIQYVNGSEILLVDLARMPSDPDYDTLGSLNLTHNVIEEVGEIDKKAKDVFSSRKNRFRNKEYGIVGKTVLTQNPSQNFTREEYYEPYKKLGMGDYQQWQIGQVQVNGEMLEAFRAFVKSLPTDNPFLDRNYLETLNRLPTQERKRLRDGNWDYMDDDSLLFKDLLLDRSFISEFTHEEKPKRALGIDVADKGKDKTVITLIENGVLIDQYQVKVETTGEVPISELTALECIKYAQQHGFSQHTSRDIGLDTIGIGVGVRDFMRSRGWYPMEYIAGAKPAHDGYNNLRSETFWAASQDMDKGKLKIYRHLNLEVINQIRRELKAHSYETEDNKIIVLPKKKVKELLGFSPDRADSINIAWWAYNGGKTAKHKSRSKIIF